MKMTITEIAIHAKDESPIFGQMVTKLRIDDEGGGAFVKLVQEDETGQIQEVRFDFSELEAIIEAIKLLEAGVGDD